MKLSDTVHIPASPERVWRGLNDPDTLKAAIPGCKSIEKVSDTEFKASAAVAFGPVKATFGGKVTLSDLDPPRGYKISGEGTGGAAGFGKGSAVVRLTPKDGGTDLSYDVEASVGGKIAQIGQRFIDQAAKKLADDFFARFATAVAPPANPSAPLPLAATQAPAPAPEPKPASFVPPSPSAAPLPQAEAGMKNELFPGMLIVPERTDELRKGMARKFIVIGVVVAAIIGLLVWQHSTG